MNKDEFNKLSIEEQISTINGLISFNGSLRRACKYLNVNLSTVQSRFKKAGYVLKDGSYYKFIIENKKSVEKLTEKLQTSAKSMNEEKLLDCEKCINDSIKDIANSFVRIGFNLSYIKQYKLYLVKGYNSIFDYALNVFNIKERTVYNLISIYNSFGKGGSLSDSYKNFSYSQLSEIVNSPNQLVKNITPETTVKQIREKKKEFKESKEPKEPIDFEDELIKLELKRKDVVSLIQNCSDLSKKEGDYYSKLKLKLIHFI